MENKIRKTFLLPPQLLKEIEKYQEIKMTGSLTAAVIQLLVKGLESEK